LFLRGTALGLVTYISRQHRYFHVPCFCNPDTMSGLQWAFWAHFTPVATVVS